MDNTSSDNTSSVTKGAEAETMDSAQHQNLAHLQQELATLRRRARAQNALIHELISHSSTLHDALQETVVQVLSLGPYGSTPALEKALRALELKEPVSKEE